MNQEKNNPLIEREKEIQKFWQDNKIFEKTLAATKSGEVFSFYDGPPFATGTPHYGHLVGSIMKDVVPRYQTMQGKYVERRWGWDCHGLPIENIVEKELKLESRKDIEKLGIDKFNEASRATVLRFADIWKQVIPRLGRWVDMENDYKTMEPWYMESIWWVFKQLWDKQLIYEGYKAMHICPRCETTLSNFEVTQGYKDITDLSVIAKFKLEDDLPPPQSSTAPPRAEGAGPTYILAWTTTPWTLIGNVALAIGGDVDYVQLKIIDREKKKQGKTEYINVILAKEVYSECLNEADASLDLSQLSLSLGLGSAYKINENEEPLKQCPEIIKEFKGKDLIGKKYQPLFDYYQNAGLKNEDNLYKIVTADFVSTQDGTGVVHIAPAFGEDDMLLGQAENLPVISHVDMSGHFKVEVKDFVGLEVKPKENHQATDVEIIKYLAKNNLLFAKEKYQHSYPHCWRCDTPLLNYSTSSWFVKVTEIKSDLIKNNQKINWVPGHIKDGRFGKWLEDARDWAISRSRYWGTPLPIWRSDDGDYICVGSVKELEELSGKKVDDLHKHVVDEIEFEKDGKRYKRITEVLDCWFESGSMPYAQFHYPFENQDKFKASFPADFIAEGADQTRGWFYTLMVLATALFGQKAFKNVIVNGIVLAEDGQKMAKRLKNYPEPEIIMEKYGADALRYYLLSSPVMSAETLNFSEVGVKEAYQKVVMLTNNILKFYQLYERADTISDAVSDNILDKWLVTKLNHLIEKVTKEIDGYNLAKAVRPIQEFIDEFSTWWLRRSRDRFKGDDEADKKQALATFKHTLLELSKVMAPFTPFMAEHVYLTVKGELESVHLEKWPQAGKVDDKILQAMDEARQVVEQGLAKRAEVGIKIRQPLSLLTVFGQQLPDDLVAIVSDEVNVKKIEFKVGKELAVQLDTEISEALQAEGMLRELVRAINGLRKKQGLTIEDKINLKWHSDGEVVNQVLTDEAMIKELSLSVIANTVISEDNDGMAVEVNGEKVTIEINLLA